MQIAIQGDAGSTQYLMDDDGSNVDDFKNELKTNHKFKKTLNDGSILVIGKGCVKKAVYKAYD